MEHRPSSVEPLQIVARLGDIPPFRDEAEEAAFWSTHRLSDALLDQMQPLGADVAPPARTTISVTLRMDPALVARLKTVARQRQMPYQGLLKRFLLERLAEVEAGDTNTVNLPDTADPESVRQTARSIAALAYDLEREVVRLTKPVVSDKSVQEV